MVHPIKITINCWSRSVTITLNEAPLKAMRRFVAKNLIRTEFTTQLSSWITIILQAIAQWQGAPSIKTKNSLEILYIQRGSNWLWRNILQLTIDRKASDVDLIHNCMSKQFRFVSYVSLSRPWPYPWVWSLAIARSYGRPTVAHEATFPPI